MIVFYPITKRQIPDERKLGYEPFGEGPRMDMARALAFMADGLEALNKSDH